MTRHINAQVAHQLADTFHVNHFSTFLKDAHASVKTAANRGAYTLTQAIPEQYHPKVLQIISYFRLFGFTATVTRGRLVVNW